MNAYLMLLVCAGLAVALSASTVLFLGSSFRRALVDVCRSESQGRFWFAFASVGIVLTSLFGALLAISFRDLPSWNESSALEVVATSFRAGLLGLLLCLAAVALGLVASIGLRPPAPEPPRIQS